MQTFSNVVRFILITVGPLFLLAVAYAALILISTFFGLENIDHGASALMLSLFKLLLSIASLLAILWIPVYIIIKAVTFGQRKR